MSDVQTLLRNGGSVRTEIIDRLEKTSVQDQVNAVRDYVQGKFNGDSAALRGKDKNGDSVDLMDEIAIRCAWRLVNAYTYRKVIQFTLHIHGSSKAATGATNTSSRKNALKKTCVSSES